MRSASAGSALGLLAALAVVAAAGGVHADDTAPQAGPAVEAPIASAFGPGYDPTRPPPEDPKETGPGIVSATVLATGPAEVEELREAGKNGAAPFFGAVLEVRIAAGSTTPVLGPASVVAQVESGHAIPLVVACTPTMDDPLAVFHGAGARLGAWNVAIDGRTWFCGGRTARLAIRVGAGGLRLTAKPESAWNGPLVLLFEAQAEPPRRIVLPGVTVELPLTAKIDDRPN